MPDSLAHLDEEVRLRFHQRQDAIKQSLEKVRGAIDVGATRLHKRALSGSAVSCPDCFAQFIFEEDDPLSCLCPSCR